MIPNPVSSLFSEGPEKGENLTKNAQFVEKLGSEPRSLWGLLLLGFLFVFNFSMVPKLCYPISLEISRQ